MATDQWEDIDQEVPLLLLPVRIETRSDDGVLRVRIYPDDIHVDAFDEELTADEADAAKQYWLARWRPTKTSDPWAELTAAVGPRRASWVATAMTPTNLASAPTAVPQFPGAPIGDPEHRPRARLLPDCFRVVVYQDSVKASETGESIDPRGIALGPRIDRPQSEGETDELRQAVDMLRGEPGADSDPELEWLTDYAAAEAAGMAVTVTLPDPDKRIERLYVIGVRAGPDPDSESTAIAELLRAHAFSDGLAFVPIGTPTNNTESSRSLWSRAASLPGEPSASPAYPPEHGSNAEVLGTALGFDPGTLVGIDGAKATDQQAAAAFATAMWPVTWGAFLDKTLVPTAAGGALPVTAREEVRQHTVAHVRGRGPLPPLRIGKQPYGVLPVTTHGSSWQPVEGGLVDAGLGGLLKRLRPLWKLAAEHVPTVTTGDIEKDLPRILGQLPVSGGARVRTALTGGEASGAITTGLGAVNNTAYQGILTAALTQLIGGAESGLWVAPDMLAKPARILALPLTHDSDPTACGALLTDAPWPETFSVLQALLTLSEARARHEWEEYLVRERVEQMIGWLRDAPGVLDADTIELGIAALERMRDRMWDERDLYKEAAEQIEASTGPFDLTRYAARYASVALRPHPVEGARAMRERVRVVAGALRVAQRYAELRLAIKEISKVESVRERALLLGETLDCASHRLDAWFTSLATRRMARTRSDRPTGIAIGAFGWLENIDIRPPATDPDDPSLYRAPGDGGYVLAPSQAHAATAAVLRGARLTHDPGDTGDAALDIDLSSTRVRAAMSIVDGMRSGQSLGALLGYRLERWLHDEPGPHLDKYIYCLRSIAPLTAAKSTERETGAVPVALESVAASEVVDGVRLLEMDPDAISERLDEPPASYKSYFDGAGPWSAPQPEIDAVLLLIQRLARLHDAVADLLLAESVHQLVLGAPARAAAAMDALCGDAIPPDPEVVRTPRSGVALTHRVMTLMPTVLLLHSGWADGHRTTVNPLLENWVRTAIGAATRVVLTSGPGGPVTLAGARIDALDLVAAAGPEDAKMSGAQRFWGMLQRRIPALVGVPLPGPDRPPGLPLNALTFAEAWALAGSVRRLLVDARALTAADLMRASDAAVGNLSGPAPNATPDTTPRLIDRADLRLRAGAAVDALRSAAQPGGSALDRADALALFGIGASTDPAALPAEELAAHVAALLKAADGRVGAAQAMLTAYDGAPPASDGACLRALAEVVQTVFDDRQPFPPVLLGSASADSFVKSLGAGVRVAEENRNASDGRDVRPWVTRYARVRPAVGRFAETLLLREALGPRRTLRVAQLAGGEFGTWIGLRFPQGSGPPEAPVTGYVVDAYSGLQPGAPLSGFVVDEWSEVVPARTEVCDPVTGIPTGETREHTTAGLAINANGPNARAPQTLLLAMSPDGQEWSVDKVVNVLTDALASTRERAVTLEQVPLVARMLPAIYVQDWSLQGEPVLDLHLLLEKSAVQSAVLTHVAEKD